MSPGRLFIAAFITAVACSRTDLASLSDAPVVEVCYDGRCGPCAIDTDCASCERCVVGTCHVEPVVQLFVGHRSTCFLGDGGSRWCVGEGSGVGVSAGASPNMPVHVSGDDGWTRLALGWFGGFGEKGGQIVQWADINPPTLYSTDASWVHLLNDRDDYCFRHADGTGMCDDADVGGGWSLLDPGPNHRCGVKNGGILCWGYDGANVLGQGVEADGTFVASPAPVGSDTDWATVSISNTLACALKDDGSLWC